MHEINRYYLELGYNGKNYHGWQSQPNAITVQHEIENALSILLKQKTSVVGAGRTDTGVHARLFVAHFDSARQLKNDDKFIHSLNGILPHDIAVYKLLKVRNEFHARFDAISRSYKYYIHLRKEPFNNEFSAFIPFTPNLDLMNEACDIIMQTKDFKSFCKAHSDVKTTICNVFSAKWKQKSDHKLCFSITADRFLRNMVRSLTGTLLDVGRGIISLDQFQEIINKKERKYAGSSVPAHGLFLIDIRYDCNVFVK